MSRIRQTVFVIGEFGFIVAGFVLGLLSTDKGGKTSLLEAAVSGGLAVLLLPLLMVLLVRFNIMVGFFKPPWEPPRLMHIPRSWDNPLPYIQLLAFVSAAMGIGAGISITWNGIQAVPTTLLGLCGGIALCLGLIRVMALTRRSHTEASDRP